MSIKANSIEHILKPRGIGMSSSSLLNSAIKLYKDGNLIDAWKTIDRHCRSAKLVEANDYLLRAEILAKLGSMEMAVRDVERALSIQPENIQGHRRILAWSTSQVRKRASANSIFCLSETHEDFQQAGEFFIKQGIADCVCKLTFTKNDLLIKAIWSKPIKINVSVGTGNDRIDYCDVFKNWQKNEEDKVHEDRYHVEQITIASSNISGSIKVDAEIPSETAKKNCSPKLLLIEQKKHYQQCGEKQPGKAEGKRSAAARKKSYHKTLNNNQQEHIVIIIPVYKDIGSLESCIKSLFKSLATNRALIVIVNDASPDIEITQLLNAVDRNFDFVELLENDHNLGFVKTINVALAHINQYYAKSDVILLNSDTVVPPDFAERLKIEANKAGNIGTVTPLSNNGEYTSFPSPFISNRILEYEQIVEIDEVAKNINGHAIDIPSGVGFCLFIKRECLDRVGFFDETVVGGYLEDLDFCMRARMLGFRNVCATNIYIGHHGSRSFTTTKRAFVVNNMKKVLLKHPSHSSESAAFVALDPLNDLRQRLEERTIGMWKFHVVIIHGKTASKTVVASRIFHHRSRSFRVLILETTSKNCVKLIDPDGGVPQTLTYNLNDIVQVESLRQILNSIEATRYEIIDLADDKLAILHSLTQLKFEYDLIVSEQNSIRVLCEGAIVNSRNPDNQMGHDDVLANLGNGHRHFNGRLSDFIIDENNIEIRKIIPINRNALISLSKLSESLLLKIDKSGMRCDSNCIIGNPPMRKSISLAIVDVKGSKKELEDIMSLISILTRSTLPYQITIFGQTYNDALLMERQEVFITNLTCTSELDDVFQLLNISAVISVCRERNFFEESDLLTGYTSLPFARFSYPYESGIRSMNCINSNIEGIGETSSILYMNQYDGNLLRDPISKAVASREILCPTVNLVIDNSTSSCAAADQILRWADALHSK